MTTFNDEIDLRPYIFALIRSWWIILFLAVIGGSIGYLLSKRQPIVYQSTSVVLLTRSRASLSLAEQFPTVAEFPDSVARMTALITIAQSDAIAKATLDELGNDFPIRDPQSLKSMLRIWNTGDAIQIQATSGDPVLSAKVANAWAHQTVNTINQVYSNGQPLSELQTQLENAKQEYFAAQAVLEDFIQNNQITELETQILEAKSMFSESFADRSRQIAYYYNRKQEMEALRVQAEALKQQLQAGSASNPASIGDALAVLITRASAFGFTPSPQSIQSTNMNPPTTAGSEPGPNPLPVPSNPSNLSFNLDVSALVGSNGLAEVYVDDLDRLIQQAIDEQSKAEAKLNEISMQVVQNQSNDLSNETAVYIRDLETRAEKEKARQREMTTSRDLAWNTYQAFVQKEIEMINNTGVNNLVNLASSAEPSSFPIVGSSNQKTIVGAALGSIIAILFVLGAQWWKSFNQPVQNLVTSPATPPVDR